MAHIAKLARLKLSEDELERMAKELSSILQYVEMLQELKTDDVTPTSQVTGVKNSLREDAVELRGALPDALLECSPLPKVERQIQAPHAHG